LNHILSFLPTKTSVSTARLSTRWRHLWQHLSVLHFSDDSHEYVNQPAERFKSFALLVNGVLALLRNLRAIQKMSLSCAHSFSDDKFREYSVETWVLAAVGPHLHELELTLFSDDDGPDFKLPQTLFSCPNLVSLRHACTHAHALSFYILHFDFKTILFAFCSCSFVSLNICLSWKEALDTRHKIRH